MAAPPAQGGERIPGGIWITALVLITMVVIWYVWHTQIVTLVFHIKLFEARTLSYLFSDVERYIEFILNIDPSAVTYEQLHELSHGLGRYLRYPAIMLLIVAALVLYRFDLQNRFSKIHSTQSLARQEVKNWPQIAPALGLDLIKQDIDQGPWAMAMTPIEFAKAHDLLEVSSDPKPQVHIKQDVAKDIFVQQLGRLWYGIDALQPYQRGLLAVFICRINRDRATAVALLNTMSRSSVRGTVRVEIKQDLIDRYYQHPQVQDIIKQHGYMLTVMSGLLEAARLDGVLASADFLWLKPKDRKLWYMLNSVGRQTPYTEVAGPFAHWQAEKALGSRLLVPMVDMAVNGFVTAVAETKYVG